MVPSTNKTQQQKQKLKPRLRHVNFTVLLFSFIFTLFSLPIFTLTLTSSHATVENNERLHDDEMGSSLFKITGLKNENVEHAFRLRRSPYTATSGMLPISQASPSHYFLEHYVDNSKPAFKNCASYRPSVKEEQPINTYVITVHADDPNPNQNITYSLVQSPSERPKFRINSQTGVIVTDHTFDRDEPIHEKAVNVIVQATDNGSPPLDDVCTFKVTIEDINDNSPVFNKGSYDESMPEDIQVSIIPIY